MVASSNGEVLIQNLSVAPNIALEKFNALHLPENMNGFWRASCSQSLE
jgi:hypothetical protein